ncbi:TlpA family protein disulfide reductase [Shewanella waksmanii]|uniref:TlpA family protein disulfide reductase n=1 Tax=Shewanella waksmanii TaxID=213783 RepID=UPI003736304B
MFRTILIGLMLIFSMVSPFANAQNAPESTQMWHYVNDQGELKVKLYFFWSETCPHCAEAHPFIDALPEHYPWIELESHLVSADGTMEKWQKIAEATNTPARSVPYIAACDNATIGYSSEAVTGQYILNNLKACYRSLGGTVVENDPIASGNGEQAPLFGTCSESAEEGTCDLGLDLANDETAVSSVQPVEIPFLGVVAPERLSLPLLTIVLAGVDAFNPCAFFVLLFLLSIMVNAKSRTRMLIVGGIFVFFSGFIYFLFMIAWLNIFKLLGAGSDGGIIILGAGILALIAGVINVKDYFFTKGEVTLSMSAENRTGLIKRMGKLTSASSMAAMIGGTIVLAILANAYELLCTAGFPMIYTSVLSMHDLPEIERYMYLVFYNVVYVIPLAIIVIVFSATLGKRKLTEKEGQTLKLMSGIMMIGMGIMLAIDPVSLQNPGLAISLIAASIGLTFIITFIRKRIEKRRK